MDNAQYTTSGQLAELVDKKVLIVLRDNRKLVGVLRSYDQYANLVLQNAVERFHAAKLYAEVPRGLYLVRGENVVLMGEVDLDLEDLPIPGHERASPEKVMQLIKDEEDARKRATAQKEKVLKQERGFSQEHADGDAYIFL